MDIISLLLYYIIYELLSLQISLTFQGGGWHQSISPTTLARQP